MNKLHRVPGAKPSSTGNVTFDAAPTLGLAALALLFPLSILLSLHTPERFLSAVRHLFAA